MISAEIIPALLRALSLNLRCRFPGVCNWNPVGTGPLVVGASQAWAGRTLAIAFDPITPSTVYIGTAGGGVWKSTDSGLSWSPNSVRSDGCHLAAHVSLICYRCLRKHRWRRELRTAMCGVHE